MTKQLSGRTRYYYGWNIVALCVMSMIFVNGIGLNSFSLFVPIWAKAFGAPPSQIVLALSISMCLALINNPVAGWASDRFPINRVMGVGLLLTALGYLLVAFAHSVLALDLIYPLVMGVGVATASQVPAQAVVARWFVRRRGLAMGITAGGLVAAGIVFPPVIVLLIPYLGWRMIWLIGAGVLAFIAAPLVLWGVVDHPPADDAHGYLALEENRPMAASASMGTILRRPNFWMLTAIGAAILCTFFNGTVNGSSFVVSHGFDLTTAGFILSLISASALAGKLLFGALADWRGVRVSLALISLTAALGSAGFYAVDSRTTLFLAAIPTGLCGGIWAVLPAALAEEFGAASVGRAFGLMTGIVPFAILAPPLVDLVKERTGHYDHALLVLAALGLLGAVICLLLQRPKSGRPGSIAEPAVPQSFSA